MIMKQLKIMILALVGCFVLTACSKDGEDGNEHKYPPENNENPPVNNDPPANNEYSDTYNIPANGCNTTYTLYRLNSEITNVNLAPGMDRLVSLESQKIWKWDTYAPDGAFWGNMGYCGGSNDWTTTTAGKWWGVTSTADFASQQEHRGSDRTTGDDSTDAYMVFDEDGNIKTYNVAGNLIRKGKFSVDMSTTNDWKMGDLYTDAGSILWPYEINGNGNMPTKFDLCLLSVDQMVLVYPDKGDFGALGGWGEATFWRFRAPSHNSDWLSVSTSAYTYGSPKVKITAKANHTNKEREYVINIRTRNNEKLTLKIVQAPGESIPSDIDDAHNEVSNNPAYSKDRQ